MLFCTWFKKRQWRRSSKWYFIQTFQNCVCPIIIEKMGTSIRYDNILWLDLFEYRRCPTYRNWSRPRTFHARR